MINERLKGSFDLSQIDIASKSLYHDPLSEYEFALRSRVMASATTDEMVNFMSLENVETEREIIQVSTAAQKIEEESFFEKNFKKAVKKGKEAIESLYFECDIIDKDGRPSNNWWLGSSENYFLGENLDQNTLLSDGKFDAQKILDSFLDEDIEKVTFRRKLTNEVKWKKQADVSRKIDKKLGFDDGKINLFGKDFNAGIEECFNCLIKIDLNAVLPALEFVFDFSKLINGIKGLIKEIDKNLNPLNIFNKLCEFSLGFGENVLCPANMRGINLILPTLFIKYSLDLMKLRFDPMSLLGNIISGVIKGIVSWVENIPRLIVPFIDCFVNATKTTFRYIKEIVSSVNKISQEVLDATNKVTTAAHKLLLNTLDLVPGYDLETLKEEKESLKKEIENLESDINKKYGEGEFQNKFIEISKELILSSKIINFSNAYVDWFIKFAGSIPSSDLSNFNKFKDFFINVMINPGTEEEGYLSKTYFDILNSIKLTDPRNPNEAKINELLQKQINKTEELKSRQKETLENKMASNRTSIEGVIENSRYISENTSSGFWEGKYKINSTQNLLNAKGKKRDMRGGRYSSNANYTRPKSEEYNLSDFLFARYGVDINQNYTHYEYSWISNSKKFMNEKSSKAIKTLSDIENKIIQPLNDTKKWIIEFTNGIILTFKNLDAFLSENVNVQFQILGEIQELLHLIRLFRIINELIQNGLSGCDEAKKNPEYFKSIVTTAAKKQGLNLETSSENNNEDYLLNLYSNKYKAVLNLDECSEISTQLKKPDINLDEIYGVIKYGFS